MVKILLFTASHTYAYDFPNSGFFQKEKRKTLQEKERDTFESSNRGKHSGVIA